ncbi:ribulose-phosphate 3-epimerase [Candidatus Bipolaricaulota bacterium]|nr:ribulose-phosphate 3-epimerase [Candidatus Bipolaricaulota bacterium]
MKLSPSLLSADFACLLDEALSVEDLVDRFHWDVMDGHFVPNLTFGPPVVNALRKKLHIPFDIHLMIDHPEVYAPQFAIQPDDVIIFHVETQADPLELFRSIRAKGARCGITLKPGTPLEDIVAYLDHVSMILVMSVEPGFGGQQFMPEALTRVRELRQLIGARDIEISIDGGINETTIRSVAQAGADIAVAGSAIFGKPDRAAAIHALRQASRE